MVLLSVSGGQSAQQSMLLLLLQLTPHTLHLPPLPVSTAFIIGLCKHCVVAVTLDTQNTAMPPSGVNYP